MSNIIAVPLNKLTYPSAIKGPTPFTDADADLLPTACRKTSAGAADALTPIPGPPATRGTN